MALLIRNGFTKVIRKAVVIMIIKWLTRLVTMITCLILYLTCIYNLLIQYV